MGYKINGKDVGHDPDSFDRSDAYKQYFDRVNNNKENIIVINNFLDDQTCDELINYTKMFNGEKIPCQWDENGQECNWFRVFSNTPMQKFLSLFDKVGALIENSFSVKIAPRPNQPICVVKWDVGTSLGIHVDDICNPNASPLASIIYLNDDYEGGELYFLDHGLSIKPKKGDLIYFPGTYNFAHEVKAVISGTRYTVPLWYDII